MLQVWSKGKYGTLYTLWTVISFELRWLCTVNTPPKYHFNQSNITENGLLMLALSIGNTPLDYGRSVGAKLTLARQKLCSKILAYGIVSTLPLLPYVYMILSFTAYSAWFGLLPAYNPNCSCFLKSIKVVSLLPHCTISYILGFATVLVILTC